MKSDAGRVFSKYLKRIEKILGNATPVPHYAIVKIHDKRLPENRLFPTVQPFARK